VPPQSWAQRSVRGHCQCRSQEHPVDRQGRPELQVQLGQATLLNLTTQSSHMKIPGPKTLGFLVGRGVVEQLDQLRTIADEALAKACALPWGPERIEAL